MAETMDLEDVNNARRFVIEFPGKYKSYSKVPISVLQTCLQTLAREKEAYYFKQIVNEYVYRSGQDGVEDSLGFLEWQCMIVDHPSIPINQVMNEPEGQTTGYFRYLYEGGLF